VSGALLGYAANMGDPRVSFTAGAVSDVQLDPSISTVNVTFSNDGSYASSGNTQGFSGNWISPVSAAGNAYEIRMTVNSGSTPTGSATASWLALGTTRTWSLSQAVVGTTTANVTVEIRKASTGTVLSSGGGAFNMSAQVVS